MTIYNLFICRVLAFSELPIGKLIRKPARNLPKENFEVGVIIVLPRLPEVDILHVVSFTLISILGTDYIQKRRGQALLFSFEYNLSPNLLQGVS